MEQVNTGTNTYGLKNQKRDTLQSLIEEPQRKETPAFLLCVNRPIMDGLKRSFTAHDDREHDTKSDRQRLCWFGRVRFFLSLLGFIYSDVGFFFNFFFDATHSNKQWQ